MTLKQKLLWFFPLLTGLVFLDLATKHWVFKAANAEIFKDVTGRVVVRGDTIDVIPNFFDLQCVMNIGAFSGWFGGQFGFLVGVSVVALLVITGFLVFGRINNLLFVLSLTFIASGTAGNLYDRIMFKGVRDFLHFFLPIGEKPYLSWPNFNVADMAICVGVGLWILIEFKKPKPAPEGAKQAAESPKQAPKKD